VKPFEQDDEANVTGNGAEPDSDEGESTRSKRKAVDGSENERVSEEEEEKKSEEERSIQ